MLKIRRAWLSSPACCRLTAIFNGGIFAHRHDPGLLNTPVPAWVWCRQTHKMTAVSPKKKAVAMLVPYALTGELAKEVQTGQ